MSSDIEIQGTCAPSFAKVRDAFGHNGWGGFGDPRGVRLIEAAYGCLPRSQEMLR